MSSCCSLAELVRVQTVSKILVEACCENSPAHAFWVNFNDLPNLTTNLWIEIYINRDVAIAISEWKPLAVSNSGLDAWIAATHQFRIDVDLRFVRNVPQDADMRAPVFQYLLCSQKIEILTENRRRHLPVAKTQHLLQQLRQG